MSELTEEDKINLWFIKNNMNSHGRDALRSYGFKEATDQPNNVTLSWSTSLDVLHGAIVAINKIIGDFDPDSIDGVMRNK